MNEKKEGNNLIGLIDTGATISALDKKIIEDLELKSNDEREIFTAGGLLKVPIYNCSLKHKNKIIELEFIATIIGDLFSFNALLGKNFINKFNILFLGEEKLFCIQILHPSK